MTTTVDSPTPSAVIDRVSLVLDAFDGPGRLTLAQIVRRTGLPGGRTSDDCDPTREDGL